MIPRRVVVTGLGALTPIGNTLPAYWEGLLSGTSGAAPITYFDASLFKTQPRPHPSCPTEAWAAAHNSSKSRSTEAKCKANHKNNT